MSVSIRFRRCGKRGRPFFRIVVADSRSPRDGRFIETIGHYNPLTGVNSVNVRTERLVYWLGKGAQATDSVRAILKKKGIWKQVSETLIENRKQKKGAGLAPQTPMESD